MKLLTFLFYLVLGILSCFLGNWLWNIFCANQAQKHPERVAEALRNMGL